MLPRFTFRNDGKLAFEDFCRFQALVELSTNGVASGGRRDWPPTLMFHPASPIEVDEGDQCVSPFGRAARCSVDLGRGGFTRCLQISKAKLQVPEDFARGELLRLKKVPPCFL
jgi:hypothetical protein